MINSISILIPCYNCDVRNLINELVSQCQPLISDFEIISLDDCGDEKFFDLNSELNTRGNVLIRRNKENLGRSANRNKLAKMAQFDYFLFIDGDSKITSDNFVRNYLISLDTGITYGGTQYPESELLHAIYAKKSEAISVNQRNDNSFLSFKSNNFFCHKSVFNKISFDESLMKYGYEDTLFAQEAKSKKIRISHIDNPVLHVGLFSDEEFLQRQKEAIIHLKELERDKKLVGVTKLQRKANSLIGKLLKKVIPMDEHKLHDKVLRRKYLRDLALYKLAIYYQK